MGKFYCVICGKYRKFKSPKIQIFEKALDLSVICSKCKNKVDQIFFKKRINQFLGLIKISWFN